MIRTILSPGVELNEVDKSQYTTDLGTVPRALVMGYASKGPAKYTTDITSMTDFRTIYGTPTNEVERYFYNAADQMIGSGATVVAAKIPYVGDDKYVGISYSVEQIVTTNDTYLYFKDGTSVPVAANESGVITKNAVTTALNDKDKADVVKIIFGNNAKVIAGAGTSDLSVFKGFENLKTIIFNKIQNIGAYAFWDCIGLINVTFTDSLETIGAYAFRGCSGLTNIKLTDNVTTISGNAFLKCTGLERIIFNDKISNIENSAFEECTNLTSVTLPSSLTSIGSRAFCKCSALTSVTIDDGETSIGNYAFQECKSLTNVSIGSGNLTIGKNIFSSCNNLKNITWNAKHNSTYSIDEYFLTNISSDVNIEFPNMFDHSDISSTIGEKAYWKLSSGNVKTFTETYEISAGHIVPNSINTIRDAVLDDSDATEVLMKELQSRGEKVESRGITNTSLNSATDTINSGDATDVLTSIQSVDSSIKNLIGVKTSKGTVIDLDTFKGLESGDRNELAQNSFMIVDKSRDIYKTFTGNGSNVDCLGILPVVTTAVNAMAIAESIGVSMNTTDPEQIPTVNKYESLNQIDYITDINTEPLISNTEISNYWAIGANTVNNGNTLNSISKIASQFFPSVNYSSNVNASANTSTGTVPFDHNYFSYIGIVVFQVGVDRGSGCLVAEPIEAFAGSLLSTARDFRTNGSVFIEDVVNTTSNYISIFVNPSIADNEDIFDKDKILYAVPSTGLILGIPPKSVQKAISFESLSRNIEEIFKSQSNILGSTLDVVVDAGLSTIGHSVNERKDNNPFLVENLRLINKCTDEDNKGPWPGWRNIIKLMKKFCEQTRKDCVFVADAPRFLSLKNQRKLVNDYGTKTVADDILPKIKLISGIGTSYGWGYTTWFKIGDAATGTSFWCPPSIFGAAAYINTRTNWHTWDAPAGMTRGVVSIDDTSFEPDLNARNVIYSNGWNYALTDIQNGVTTLEGQKTFQSYQSAFDRINVRSLFLDLERRVFKIARNYIYEPNTADTRQQFVDNITPIFSSTKAQGGCYDYKIICDETLNTPQVIDNNELRIRIGVQPTKTIEFILIEMVATRTGSDWSELVME